MAENIPSTVSETPVVYKRFSQADKISQGTNNAALSLNDYIPGQHVTGPNQNDIAATLAQLQAIPIGTATLNGNTYNVTISNYPNSATIYPGQKISVQFQNDAPTAEDTALNLSAFGKSLPMCARGIRMSRGSIKAGMVLNFIYWPDKWNADYDLVENVNGVLKYAESSRVYNKQSVDGALENCSKSYSFAFAVNQYTHIKANIKKMYGTTEIKVISRSGYAFSLYLAGGDGDNVNGIMGKKWTGTGQDVRYKANLKYMDLYISVPLYISSLNIINLNENTFSLEYVEIVTNPPTDTLILTL